MRELRRTVGLFQREFAERLRVPVNSQRMWDSGIRTVPRQILRRAEAVVAAHAHEAELLPLNLSPSLA